MLINAIIFFSILANILIALFVIASNPKSIAHRYFFAVTIAFISFGLINYISLNPILLDQITWIRLDLVSAVYLFMLLYLTFYVFPDKTTDKLPRFGKVFVIYSLIISFVTLTPLVFTHIEETANGVQPIPGPGIGLFVVQQILALVMIGYIYVKKYKRSNKPQKRQLKIVMSGAAFSIVTIILANLVAVQVFQNKNLIPFSSLGVLVFTFSFAFSVLRYKFLDVRLIVARAIAYVLLLLTLSAIYALSVFVIASQITGAHFVLSRQIIPILAAVVLVFTAPFFKRLFDRITNRFFYQDAYDPQALFDELNKVLIGNIELSILLRQANEVVQKHMKSQFCAVAVCEGRDQPLRIVGTNDMHLSLTNSALFKKEVKSTRSKIIVADDISTHHNRLKQILSKGNIAVVVKLHPGTGDTDDLAYLLMGLKRSGNLYSRHDLKVIEIIADSMVIAIQNALRFEEIQSFAATLQEKVDEATARLKKTNAKLRELDETKDEFISMASHQLRTPLTSVKGYLSMVLEGDGGKVSKDQKDLLEPAFFSAQRMVYLIADLLNVSRLKTGKFVIAPNPTNIAEMVAGELAQLDEIIKGKKVLLKYNRPKNFSQVMLDETKTRQVVMNFIDNAIYYTPQGGHVIVEVKEDKNNIYFTVKDDGIGIPKQDQKHLFGKFYRAENAKKVRPDGTGLGLFMAKRVIEAQGGSIVFDSEEGKGSTFGFTFSKSKLRGGKPASKQS